jgi:hypothetical protein
VYENIWDLVKTILKGNLIAINAYIIMEERSQINNVELCLKDGK